MPGNGNERQGNQQTGSSSLRSPPLSALLDFCATLDEPLDVLRRPRAGRRVEMVVAKGDLVPSPKSYLIAVLQL